MRVENDNDGVMTHLVQITNQPHQVFVVEVLHIFSIFLPANYSVEFVVEVM